MTAAASADYRDRAAEVSQALATLSDMRIFGWLPFGSVSAHPDDRELMKQAQAIVDTVASHLRTEDGTARNMEIIADALQGAVTLMALEALGAVAYEKERSARSR